MSAPHRTKQVIANWKMNGDAKSAAALSKGVVDGVNPSPSVKVVLCPPTPYLQLVSETIAGSAIQLGAQNFCPHHDGPWTGEVSGEMLLDVGCTTVIVGHSERRKKLHESEQLINSKVGAGLALGLSVVLCLGESSQERLDGATEVILSRQLRNGLSGLLLSRLGRLTIAYEPLWAIGEGGKTATLSEIEQTHELIRQSAESMFGERLGSTLPILYGGNVKPENALEILGLGPVDGVLVGGASLVLAEFLAIVQCASDVLGIRETPAVEPDFAVTAVSKHGRLASKDGLGGVPSRAGESQSSEDSRSTVGGE